MGLKIAVAVVSLASSMAASASDDERPPNVVLIISDYMGYQDIEPYGATDIKTPSLSRLASEGVTMTDFYAAAPVCAPARAALYSGQYPARLGFEGNVNPKKGGLASQVPTLPRWLKGAGYRTALFGKWHLGSSPSYTPNAHGFDEFLGHHDWTVGYYDHKNSRGEPGLYRNDSLIERDGYLTDLLSAEAVRFIDRNRGQPFFLTLSYNAALPPYQPPGLPESRWGEGWDVDTATRDDYRQMVERMDEGIGHVLDKLDVLDIARNTLVIYLYDHGGRHLANSGPLFHGFGTLWEGGIRIPTIMRLPGVLPADTRSSLPGIAMDLTATIVDVAGVEGVLKQLDGESLISVLRKERAPPRRKFYWRSDTSAFGKQRAIRDGKWKYVEHGHTQFLFDLSSDLGERRNLFYKEPEVVSRLRRNLESWFERFP